ncbi:glycosyltransferase [Duganella sp. FT94W]|uniref:Glycosyltransferase n=1 Tax=Duganella lactea TaxID=2692173 RepID=A0ABW9VAZ9_9BURK|nr:glycosyltransferase [Duganella lactea]
MKVVVLAGLARSLSNFRGKLLLALTQTGAEVHAVAPELSDDATTSAAMANMGVHCHDVPLLRTGLNPWQDGRTLLAMIGRLRQVRPTHFLAYTIKPVIYGTVAAWIAGVPQRTALITGLGYAFNAEARGLRGVLQRLLRLMYRFALGRATRVIFQNPDDRALFIELGLVDSDKTVVVNGSGIPLDDFAQQPLPSSEGCHFLLIARLLGDKGIHEYIKAARLVKQRHPNTAVFHLVGWIDSNPAAIKQSDLDSWIAEGLIQFHGKLSDVRPPLAACHVYVLPSYREGTPRTVLEAMATGRAVITTDAPGCRETVTDGENGYLVPVADADALATAMLRFLDQPALISSMGQRGREIAVDKYDVHKVNAHMLNHMGVNL